MKSALQSRQFHSISANVVPKTVYSLCQLHLGLIHTYVYSNVYGFFILSSVCLIILAYVLYSFGFQF